MVELRVCLTAGVMACVLARPVSADAVGQVVPALESFPAEVSIPNTRRVEFTSRINGHRFSISVALPFVPPPPQGYGVLYVLDGYAYFASATEVVRGRSNAPEGVVVVGIGYPDDPTYSRSVLTKRGPVPAWYANLPPFRNAPWLERTYDLTLPASDGDLAAQTPKGAPEQKSQDVGGLDDMLKTIETEVKPRVAALAPLDSTNQALFGHSLGGLAVLRALFVEPNAFRTFIIASPSIWWNNRKVLADEESFAAAIRTGKASPRILVTMGSEESTLPRLPPGVVTGIDEASRKDDFAKARMVENGRELVSRLRSLHGTSAYVVEDYTVFDKVAHSFAAWPALGRGIAFAFPDTP